MMQFIIRGDMAMKIKFVLFDRTLKLHLYRFFVSSLVFEIFLLKTMSCPQFQLGLVFDLINDGFGDGKNRASRPYFGIYNALGWVSPVSEWARVNAGVPQVPSFSLYWLTTLFRHRVIGNTQMTLPLRRLYRNTETRQCRQTSTICPLGRRLII